MPDPMIDPESSAFLAGWEAARAYDAARLRMGNPPDRDEAYEAAWEQYEQGRSAMAEALAAPALPAEPGPGMVRVRIAVCVAGPKAWAVSGWSGASDADLMDTAVSSVEADPYREAWITADVPLPAPPSEVAGSVEPR